MDKSEDTTILDTSLEAFQDQSGFVKATKENPFLKNKYIDYNNVVAQCRPELKKHGLVIKQLITFISVTGQGAIYTKLTHTDSKQFYSSIAPLTHKDNDPQSQGSAITYMKRYSYIAMLDLLVDADDDGNLANSVGEKADKKRDAAEFYAEKSKLIKELQTEGLSLDDIAAGVRKTLGKEKIETLADIKKIRETK
jgi:hypothetical protein